MTLLKSLVSAANSPIAQKIIWPESIQSDHPIRTALTHIRLWPNEQGMLLQAKFKELAELKKADPESEISWLDDTFFWVVALGLATPEGQGAFTEDWPIIIQSLEIQSVKKSTLPKIDYKKVGEYLKGQFNGPLGRHLIEPVWTQIMDFNGYSVKKDSTEAKNSEKTATSVPSGS